MKRIFDIVFSLAVLILGFFVFSLIALLVKLSSRGPILYCSKRVGLNGTTFFIYKFRTMYEDAESRLKEVLKTSSELRQEWECYRKLKIDPRITLVGSILRKLSLDELPQFVNVLKGEMSVVGPRPVTEEEISKYYQEKAQKILSIRPGITGLWQTSGRNDLDFGTRIMLEEDYVDRASFFLDMMIVFKTIFCMIFSKGAF